MTQESAPLRAFLVDDEPLALERLQRLLAAFPEIQIIGTATDPSVAAAALNSPDDCQSTCSSSISRCRA